MYYTNHSRTVFLKKEWKRGPIPMKKRKSSGAQTGPRQMNATKLGYAAMARDRGSALILGQYATVFQADVYAIMACVVEDIKSGYWKISIYILSDSQAVIKALDNCKINSKLVWDCNNPVRGCKDTKGPKVMRYLTARGSLRPFIGHQPACGIPDRVAKWAKREMCVLKAPGILAVHPAQRHSKSFLPDLSVRRTVEFLKFNRFQARQVTGVLTRHC
jgi:hypothetical protein